MGVSFSLWRFLAAPDRCAMKLAKLLCATLAGHPRQRFFPNRHFGSGGWRSVSAGGVQFALRAIPLGGFVRLLTLTKKTRPAPSLPNESRSAAQIRPLHPSAPCDRRRRARQPACCLDGAGSAQGIGGGNSRPVSAPTRGVVRGGRTAPGPAGGPARAWSPAIGSSALRRRQACWEARRRWSPGRDIKAAPSQTLNLVAERDGQEHSRSNPHPLPTTTASAHRRPAATQWHEAVRPATVPHGG